MRALTLHRSWAWAMMHGEKRVENRSWKPSSKYYGQRIAIHAGSNAGHREVQSFVRGRYRRAPRDNSWPSGILGTVKVLGVVHKDARGRTSYEGVNNPIARAKVRAAMRSPYFHGPYGWIVDDPRPLQVPVPHEGKLMLWTPDKWKYSSAAERPPASLVARMINRTAAQMRKAGPGTATAG